MLETILPVITPSVERLYCLWAQRYTVDLSLLGENSSFYTSILETGSQKGRELTTKKLKDSILDVDCQMAWIQTKNLYNYIPNVINLNEARRITLFSFRVYKKLLEIYRQQSLNTTSPTNKTQEDILTQLKIPSIEELAYALEPILIIFQEQHLASKDWRALGFMTTQLNFSNQLILRRLTKIEQALLTPWLKFVEEQVAMPWQRMCAAVANQNVNSPKLALVEKMLPFTTEISESVYRQLVELFPHYESYRGALSNKDIKHSCIRDLDMFQAYLWLCFLKESMAPIAQELLPLCAMVVQGIGIQWELTEKWYQILTEEILKRLDSEQKILLLPYTQSMQQIFFNERSRLCYQEKTIVCMGVGSRE